MTRKYKITYKFKGGGKSSRLPGNVEKIFNNNLEKMNSADLGNSKNNEKKDEKGCEFESIPSYYHGPWVVAIDNNDSLDVPGRKHIIEMVIFIYSKKIEIHFGEYLKTRTNEQYSSESEEDNWYEYYKNDSAKNIVFNTGVAIGNVTKQIYRSGSSQFTGDSRYLHYELKKNPLIINMNNADFKFIQDKSIDIDKLYKIDNILHKMIVKFDLNKDESIEMEFSIKDKFNDVTSNYLSVIFKEIPFSLKKLDCETFDEEGLSKYIPLAYNDYFKTFEKKSEKIQKQLMDKKKIGKDPCGDIKYEYIIETNNDGNLVEYKLNQKEIKKQLNELNEAQKNLGIDDTNKNTQEEIKLNDNNLERFLNYINRKKNLKKFYENNKNYEHPISKDHDFLFKWAPINSIPRVRYNTNLLSNESKQVYNYSKAVVGQEINKILHAASAIMTKKFGFIGKKIDNFNKFMKDNINEISEKFYEKYKNLKEGITNSINDLYTTFMEQKQKFVNQLTNLAQKIKDTTLSLTDSTYIYLITNYIKYKENINKFIKEQMEYFEVKRKEMIQISKSIGNKAAKYVETAKNKSVELMNDAKNKSVELMNDAFNLYNSFKTKFFESVRKSTEIINESIKNSIDNIKDVYKVSKEFMGDKANEIKEMAKKLKDSIIENYYKSLDNLKNLKQYLITSFNHYIDKFNENFEEILNSGKDKIIEAYNASWNMYFNITNKLKTFYDQKIEEIKSKYNDVKEYLTNSVINIKNNLIVFGQNALSLGYKTIINLKTKAQEFIKETYKKIGDFVNKKKEFINKQIDNLIEYKNLLVENTVKYATQINTQITKFVEDKINNLKEFISESIKSVIETSKKIYDEMKNNIEITLGNIEALSLNALSYIDQKMKDTKKFISDTYTYSLELYIESKEAMINSIKSFINGLYNKLKKLGESTIKLGESTKKIATEIANKIKDVIIEKIKYLIKLKNESLEFLIEKLLKIRDAICENKGGQIVCKGLYYITYPLVLAYNYLVKKIYEGYKYIVDFKKTYIENSKEEKIKNLNEEEKKIIELPELQIIKIKEITNENTNENTNEFEWIKTGNAHWELIKVDNNNYNKIYEESNKELDEYVQNTATAA